MRKKNFNNYQKVAGLISAYYRDPEKSTAAVEKELGVMETSAAPQPVVQQKA